jgi:hypothetical protein
LNDEMLETVEMMPNRGSANDSRPRKCEESLRIDSKQDDSVTIVGTLKTGQFKE